MNELVEVKELRERYMYNINPWVSHVAKRGLRLFYTESDIDETDSDDDVDGKSSVVTANNDRKDDFRTKRKLLNDILHPSDEITNSRSTMFLLTSCFGFL